MKSPHVPTYCTVVRAAIPCPAREPRIDTNAPTSALGCPSTAWRAASRSSLPSTRRTRHTVAPQSRAPCSAIACMTGVASDCEVAMMASTLAIAACRSSASLTSRLRCASARCARAVSIATAACSAKASSVAISLAPNGLTSTRTTASTPATGSVRPSGAAIVERIPAKRIRARAASSAANS